MKIICDTTFLDDRDRFEQGDIRTVDAAKGAYFISNKWAHEVGNEAAAPVVGEVTLDVQNGKLAQEARNG